MLLLAPMATAQSVSDRLGDLHFGEIVVTVGPTEVQIEANHGNVAGTTASDLRKCIDKSNCPDSRLNAASNGNGDGRVDQAEVDGFEDRAILGLNAALSFGGSGALADFGRQLRDLVRIDDQGPTSVTIDRLDLAGAVGTISSTTPVQVTFVMKVAFDTAKKATHDVAMTRTAAEIDLADRIVVRAAAGWTIPQGSVGPDAMRARFSGGTLQGSQAEMQGTDPLTFTIKSPGGIPWWGWTLLVLVVLGAGAGVAYYLRQRRGKA